MTASRDGVPIVVKYALIDMTDPNVQAMRADLKTVLAKVGSHLELSATVRLDGLRAVVKAAYLQADAATVAGWFANRTWKSCVLGITDWDQRAQVVALVTGAAWIGPP